ncbi:MAG: hypothetical protein B7X50_06495 [Alishewanella sp. 34-51-39]|nr:MAG: hypothetical protein B7X50_06495 [Alishewanella sp. 34-51-39]
MSEYQYYRFECLDGFLDSRQRHALRQISSRAEITATSFQVYYHYSGLRAEPCDVVLDYFDIGFYYADWGSINAYIKLPAGTLPDELMQITAYCFNVYETDQWQMLVFSTEEYDDYLDDEQAADFFQHLATLRSELLQGDWRLLYFVWLKELDCNDELAAVPLIHFDFNNLSNSQVAFAALFDIPLPLVKALALTLASNPGHQPKQSQLQIDVWLSQLTEQEKDNLLQLLLEQGQLTRQQALAMTSKTQIKQETYQHWLSAERITPYIEQAETQFKQEQAASLAQKQAKEKAEKEAQLSQLYQQREHFWQKAQMEANRSCASGYDQAARYLQQLAEAYQLKGQTEEFARLFKRFIASNASRKALLKRLQNIE